MAVKLKFECSENSSDYLEVGSIKYQDFNNVIRLYGIHLEEEVDYHFDISTAIKLVKTLRLEISKIKEVDNG